MKRKKLADNQSQKPKKRPAKKPPVNILRQAQTILDSEKFSSELQRLRKFLIANLGQEMDFKKFTREIFLKLPDHEQYPFHAAVLIDSANNIKLFAESKSLNINQNIKGLGTPLAFACCVENTGLMRLLLSVGAAPPADHDDWVLFYALRSGNREVIEFLTKQGVKISPKNLEDLALNYVRPALRGGAVFSIYYLFEKIIATQNETLILQLVCLLWIAGVRGDCLSPLLSSHTAEEILKTILTNNKLITLYVTRFAPQKRIISCYSSLSSWSGLDKENLAHWGASHNNQSVLKYYLKHHPDMFSSRDREGYTPIFWAAGWDCGEAVNRIIQKIPGTVTQQGPDGQYLSHSAAKCGHLETLKLLAKAEPSLLMAEDDKGATPIVWAVRNGRLSIFQFMAGEVKEAIDWRGKEGENIIHHLIKSHQEDLEGPPSELQLRLQALFKYIIGRHPGLLTVEDKDGYSPMAWAVGWGCVTLLDMSCQYSRILAEWRHSKNGRTLIHQIAAAGHPKVFNYFKKNYPELVQHYLRVLTTDDSYPPIVLAAREGHLSMVQAIEKEFKEGIQWREPVHGNNIVHSLIQSYGSDRNGQSDKQKKIQEVFNYLKIRYPDLLTMRKFTGYPPIALAAGYGASQLLQLFCENDFQAIKWRHEVTGMTLAHNAAIWSHLNVIKYLMAHCPDLLNARNLKGDLPLFEGIANNQLKLVQWYQKEVPGALKSQTIDGGNLLHYLAVNPTNTEKDTQLPAIELEDKNSRDTTETMERVQLIDFLILNMPGALDQMDNLGEIPFSKAVKCRNYYLLAYILAGKPKFGSSLSLAEMTAMSIIQCGLTNFLPIYWHLMCVPQESGYAFDKNIVHIILDYAIQHASAFILLRTMKDEKAEVGQTSLLCQSIPHYIERYQKLAEIKKVKPLETVYSIEIIKAVEKNEFAIRCANQQSGLTASVSLFSNSNEGTSRKVDHHFDQVYKF